MALSTIAASKKFRATALALAGLLTIVTLAACGSEPESEPGPQPVAAAPAAVSPTPSPVPEARLEQPAAPVVPPTAVATIPEPLVISPGPTPFGATNPFLVEPGPTQAAQPAIVIAPVSPTEQPESSSAEAPATAPVYADIGPDTTWATCMRPFPKMSRHASGPKWVKNAWTISWKCPSPWKAWKANPFPC